jgi:hypothetical protein
LLLHLQKENEPIEASKLQHKKQPDIPWVESALHLAFAASCCAFTVRLAIAGKAGLQNEGRRQVVRQRVAQKWELAKQCKTS